MSKQPLPLFEIGDDVYLRPGLLGFRGTILNIVCGDEVKYGIRFWDGSASAPGYWPEKSIKLVDDFVAWVREVQRVGVEIDTD